MEPRNNVSITFDISRDAADKLKKLLDKDDSVFKNLGILSVNINRNVSKLQTEIKKESSLNDPLAGTSTAGSVSHLEELLSNARKNLSNSLSTTSTSSSSSVNNNNSDNVDIASARRAVANFFGHQSASRNESSSVNGLSSNDSSVKKSENALNNAIISNQSNPVVQLTNNSNSTTQTTTTQPSILIDKNSSLTFANVQYTVQTGKPVQNTYTLTTANAALASSTQSHQQLQQQLNNQIPSQHIQPHSTQSQILSNSSTMPSVTIQTSHLNHSNHQPQIVSLQNHKNISHSYTTQTTSTSSSSSSSSPLSSLPNQTVTINCQRFASPQHLQSHPLNRSSNVQVSAISNSLNHKNSTHQLTSNQIQNNSSTNPNNSTHTVFAVSSPSIKSPYIRNPNVANSNIRFGLQTLTNDLKEVRQLNLPNNTIVTVSTCSTGSSISFPTSALSNMSTLNTVTFPTSSGISTSDLVGSSISTSASNTNTLSTSNVALTSPLLVNLLQSDVSCDTNNAVMTVPVSSTGTIGGPFTGTTVTSLPINHSNVIMHHPPPSALKEPIAKKAKTKKSRKPKDKPPDSESKANTNDLSSISKMQFTTSVSGTGIKLTPGDVFQSQLLQNRNDSISQLVQNTNLVITSSSSASNSNDSDKSRTETISEPNISILPISKEVQLTDYDNSNLRLMTSNSANKLNSTSGTTSFTAINSKVSTKTAISGDQVFILQTNSKTPGKCIDINVSSSNAQQCSLPLSSSASTVTEEQNGSSQLIVQSKKQSNLDQLIDKCAKLSQKKSDSFLNLPSPVEENKTKHLINPFTGHMEPMMSEDDEDEPMDDTPALSSTFLPTATTSGATSDAVSITTIASSLPISINNNLNNSNNNKLPDLKDNPSDSDSGIGKSSTDGSSSQSSSEISPIEASNTLTVSDMLLKSNEMESCLSNVSNQEITATQSKTIAFIPTLLDQEPNDHNHHRSLNAHVNSLACDLVTESADSLLATDRIVNVNEMLTGASEKDLTINLETTANHSLIENSFVDGLLNHAPLDKLSSVQSSTSSTCFVEGEICTLISDSACSETYEMIVDEPSKVLNDVFSNEPSNSMISTLNNNFQYQSGACEEGNRKVRSTNQVEGDDQSEPMVVEEPQLEEMQVTVQCIEDHGTIGGSEDISTCIETSASNASLTAGDHFSTESNKNHEMNSNLINKSIEDLDSLLTDKSGNSTTISSNNDVSNQVELSIENEEPLEVLNDLPSLLSSQLQSVASGDHNYTSLKRNCVVEYSKMGTNVKNVNI